MNANNLKGTVRFNFEFAFVVNDLHISRMKKYRIELKNSLINYLFVASAPVDCRFGRADRFAPQNGHTTLFSRNSSLSIDNSRLCA